MRKLELKRGLLCFTFADTADLRDTIARAGKRKFEDCIQQGHAKQSRSDPMCPDDDLELPQVSNLDVSKATKLTMATHGAVQDLNNSIAREKKKSRNFEEFLEKAVADGDDLHATLNSDTSLTLAELSSTERTLTVPIFTQPLEKLEGTVTEKPQTLDGKMDELNARIESAKRANMLFEMKLQSFLSENL